MSTPLRHAPSAKPWAGRIVVVIAGLLLALVGGLVVFAVPRFVKFHPHSKQSEAKSNLKGFFTAEKAWFAEHHEYNENVETFGYLPERNNRYLYVVSPRGDLLVQGAPDGGRHTGVWTDERLQSVAVSRSDLSRVPPSLLSEGGVHCEGDGGCWLTVFAIGNLDADATLDVWSISTRDRELSLGTVPAGVPFMHVNDLD